MAKSEEQPLETTQGLDLLDEHDAAPEISQLLDYGQHRDEKPATSPAEHLRIARLSVIQTVALSVLVALISLAAVFFALHSAKPSNPNAPPVPEVNTTITPITPAPSVAPSPEANLPPVEILPAQPTTTAPIQPGFCSISQTLQGPAADYIAWHYKDNQLQFQEPLARAFETTLLVLAKVYGGSSSQRLIAFAPDGSIRWEVDQARGEEKFRALGGSSLYAVLGVGNKLRGYDGWGKLAWEKEFPARLEGEVLSDSRSFLYAIDRYGVLYCMAPHGDLQWQYDPDTHKNYLINPLIDSGVLLVDSSGTLHQLDRRGNLLWRKELDIRETPVRGKDGALFARAPKQHLLYKLDAGGEVIWQVHTAAGGDVVFGGMIPLDDGGVIVAYSYPNCIRYDAQGNAKELCRYTGVSAAPYQLDESRFVIPTRMGELLVYDIDGLYDYSMPLESIGKHGYIRDPAGNLYLIAGMHQIAAVKPLP